MFAKTDFHCLSRSLKFCSLAIFALLVACTSHPKRIVDSQTPVDLQKDGAPPESYSVSHIPDAIPREETRTAAGNKSPYTVLGKTYNVMPSSDGFVEKGSASWYGTKFHGRRTSNGEIYDMYGMTAAHKTLPIPTFVRVKNLENGKEVIVRVNDRGPFHGGRIIDLTYAAAKKLGYQSKGTASVIIEALDPRTFQQSSASSKPLVASANPLHESSPIVATQSSTAEKPAPTPSQAGGYALPDNTYLQAGAFSAESSANTVLEKISALTTFPVFIVNSASAAKKIFRVRIGPITDNWELVNLQTLIEREKLGSPHIVRE